MGDVRLPVGKLPPDLLSRLLSHAPLDESVVLGPGIGLDCAVVESSGGLLVLKSDPITFASDEIGWYAVQVNANDIATTGAAPRWFLATLLLPEGKATDRMALDIMRQVYSACREMHVSVVGGHTEITYGIDRPILVGTMLGQVTPDELLTPRGAAPGDALLLTKGIPIEATALLAREFAKQLSPHLSEAEIKQAQETLYQPGISVLRDAQIALQAGRVHAMHDPTEGGLSAALWELAEASGRTLWIDPQAIHMPPLSAKVLDAFQDKRMNPMAAIASGALLLAVHADDANKIASTLEDEEIQCSIIGGVEKAAAATGDQSQPVTVWQETPAGRTPLPRPDRDEIARIFEEMK